MARLESAVRRHPPRLVLGFLAVMFLATHPRVAATSIEFDADFHYVLTFGGLGVSAIADFDRDGHQDAVAITGGFANVLQWYRGLGNGRFAPGVVIGNDWAPLRAGDLNADGRPDVVTRSGVRLGRGDGTFDPLVTQGPGASCCSRGLVLADFNGDGHQDAAYGREPTGAAFLPGLGDGRFGSLVDVPMPGRVVTLAAGDLDHDGKDDLVACVMDSAWIALGASISSGSPLFLRLQGPGQGLVDADLDEDGNSDLVNGSSWFRGHGDGTFDIRVDFGTGEEDLPLAIDIDADGHVDVLSILEQYEIVIRRGRGDGTLMPPVEWPTTIVTADHGLEAADLDGDGALDLVTSGNYGNLSVHLQSPGAVFGVDNDVVVGPYLVRAETDDFDGDGRADVAALDATGQGLALYRGDGAGGFTLGSFTSGLVGLVHMLTAGDLDGDGDRDVAHISFNDEILSVYLNQGDGTFAPRADYPDLANPYHMAIGDLDRDGRMDLVTVGFNSGTFRVYRGQASGTLAPPVEYPVGTNGRSIGVADLDADGWLDVVVGRQTALEVRRGGPGGALGPATLHATPTFANRMGFGDFDHDGDVDLVASSAHMFVMPGNGDGTFGPAGPIRPVSWSPDRLKVADVDLDGHVDVLISSPGDNAIVTLPGDGVGGFGEPLGLGTGPYNRDFAVADFDSDGLPDLAAVHLEGLTLLRNRLPRAVGVEPSLATGTLWVSAPHPNPASRGVTLTASLATAGRARLRVFDLSGRSVVERDLGALAAGRHRLGLSLPDGVAPGLYWIALTAAERSVVTRLAVVR